MALMNMWDERFSAEEYIYGTEPNQFFKTSLDKLKPGTLLMPCEGEGRNAVYASKLGWEVEAFDSSIEGQKKAFKLAQANNAQIDYHLLDAVDYKPIKKFDAIGLIYCHFHPKIRMGIHVNLIKSLKPGGAIILEAFNKKQINNNTGGPRDIDLLYSIEIIKDDFRKLKIEMLKELTIEIHEGHYHDGKSDIIRLIAINENK